jgi:peptidoglycan/xylan/chitin deacetylase (PgdA/CDA1 family)
VTLSSHELHEIAAVGHIIGAHTHTHPVLTAVPAPAAHEEIPVAKIALEDLQRPIQHFAYPFGMRRHFNQSLRAYCRDLAFATVADAIPCMQHAQSRPRTCTVRFGSSITLGIQSRNLRIDGRTFNALTG